MPWARLEAFVDQVIDGVTAVGWTLVSAGLRLVSLPQRPPAHRSALW